MKKKVMAIAIVTVIVLSLGLMFATPVLAGNGPQDNNGQTWKATPPGEKMIAFIANKYQLTSLTGNFG